MRTIPLTELNEAISVRREFGVGEEGNCAYRPNGPHEADGCCAIGRMITDEEWNMLLKYIEENDDCADDEIEIYEIAEEKTPGEIVSILTSLGQPAPPYTETQLYVLQKFHDDNCSYLDDDGEGILTSLPDYLGKVIESDESRLSRLSDESMSVHGIDYATARLEAAKELLEIWKEEQK